MARTIVSTRRPAGPIFRAAHAELHGIRPRSRRRSPPARSERRLRSRLLTQPLQWGVGLTAGGGMDYDLPFKFSNVASRYACLKRTIATFTQTSVLQSCSHTWHGRWSRKHQWRGSELRYRRSLWPHHPPAAGYLRLRNLADDRISRRPGHCDGNGNQPPIRRRPLPTPGWVIPALPSRVPRAPATSIPRRSHLARTNVKGHVSEGVKPGQMADCAASFTVKAFEPPDR